MPDFTDTVSISSLQVSANIGADCWGRNRHQPIIISVDLHLNPLFLQTAGHSDDVRDSVHYGDLCKTISKLVVDANFDGLRGLAEAVTKAALGLAGDAVEEVKVCVEAPKQYLLADGFGMEMTTSSEHPTRAETRVFVKGLTLAVIIGINPPERESKQRVIFDISFFEENTQTPTEIDYISLISLLSKWVEDSKYQTLEKLVLGAVCKACTYSAGIHAVRLRAQKPSALSFAHASSVEITRPRSFFVTS